jgi:U3 small nucleolar RNA-associated protein 3
MIVHESRDKILFQENDFEDDGSDQDEVFRLEGVEESDGTDENLDEDGYQDEDTDEFDRTEDDASKKNPFKAKIKAQKDTSSEDESASDEDTWGRSKSAYYSSNAAQLDSDDEEANELEEKEAMRLQAKARDGMEDEDFGLDDRHDTASHEHDTM